MAQTFKPDNVTVLQTKTGEIPADATLLIQQSVIANSKVMQLGKVEPMEGLKKSFEVVQQYISENIEVDILPFLNIHQTNDFLKDYLYNPDLSKTICLEGVIRHFKVMPSMKGKITEKEIEEVNHFLYFLEGFNGVNKFYHDDTKF